MNVKESVGLEEKIISIFYRLDEKYKFGETYVLSFHIGNYGREAFYDHALETSEDASCYMIRMSRGSMVKIPKEALKDYTKPDFLQVWGEPIYKTLISRRKK